MDGPARAAPPACSRRREAADEQRDLPRPGVDARHGRARTRGRGAQGAAGAKLRARRSRAPRPSSSRCAGSGRCARRLKAGTHTVRIAKGIARGRYRVTVRVPGFKARKVTRAGAPTDLADARGHRAGPLTTTSRRVGLGRAERQQPLALGDELVRVAERLQRLDHQRRAVVRRARCATSPARSRRRARTRRRRPPRAGGPTAAPASGRRGRAARCRTRGRKRGGAGVSGVRERRVRDVESSRPRSSSYVTSRGAQPRHHLRDARRGRTTAGCRRPSTARRRRGSAASCASAWFLGVQRRAEPASRPA